jgi:CheY-like chemotaxis protein
MTQTGQILLIEDDPVLGEVLQEVWTAEGYTVVVATQLKAAIEQLGQASFDLVVTDCLVRQWDPAMAWLAPLRPYLGEAALVLCTAHSEARALDLAAHGLVAVWDKPFDIRDLLEATQQALSTSPPR